MNMYNSKPPIERFNERYMPEPNTGCWLWLGGINYKGYGVFPVEAKNKSAHRYSYRIHKGEIGDKWVLHSCDTRSCVNPDHLFLGTHQDNMDDMNRKGRNKQLRGENHIQAKLTEDQIREIRKIGASMKQRDLGKLFGTCQTNIRRILNRTIWSHVQ